MTWLEGNGRDKRTAGERIRELIAKPEILGVPGAHNGLAGMRERVDLLGGLFTLDSAPGIGTHLRADLPLGEQTEMLGRS